MEINRNGTVYDLAAMSLEELRKLEFDLSNDLSEIEFQLEEEERQPNYGQEWVNRATKAAKYKQNALRPVRYYIGQQERNLSTAQQRNRAALDLIWEYADSDSLETLHYLIDQIVLTLFKDERSYMAYIQAWSGSSTADEWPRGTPPELYQPTSSSGSSSK